MESSIKQEISNDEDVKASQPSPIMQEEPAEASAGGAQDDEGAERLVDLTRDEEPRSSATGPEVAFLQQTHPADQTRAQTRRRSGTGLEFLTAAAARSRSEDSRMSTAAPTIQTTASQDASAGTQTNPQPRLSSPSETPESNYLSKKRPSSTSPPGQPPMQRMQSGPASTNQRNPTAAPPPPDPAFQQRPQSASAASTSRSSVPPPNTDGVSMSAAPLPRSEGGESSCGPIAPNSGVPMPSLGSPGQGAPQAAPYLRQTIYGPAPQRQQTLPPSHPQSVQAGQRLQAIGAIALPLARQEANPLRRAQSQPQLRPQPQPQQDYPQQQLPQHYYPQQHHAQHHQPQQHRPQQRQPQQQQSQQQRPVQPLPHRHAGRRVIYTIILTYYELNRQGEALRSLGGAFASVETARELVLRYIESDLQFNGRAIRLRVVNFDAEVVEETMITERRPLDAVHQIVTAYVLQAAVIVTQADVVQRVGA